MKGTNLGEFEELVLLTIASLASDAYSVAICDELEKYTGRTAKLGVVHAVLNRLEEKGMAKSRLGEATSARGGKRKRFYEVSHTGKVALMRSKEMRENIWRNIPALILKAPYEKDKHSRTIRRKAGHQTASMGNKFPEMVLSPAVAGRPGRRSERIF